MGLPAFFYGKVWGQSKYFILQYAQENIITRKR